MYFQQNLDLLKVKPLTKGATLTHRDVQHIKSIQGEGNTINCLAKIYATVFAN